MFEKNPVLRSQPLRRQCLLIHSGTVIIAMEATNGDKMEVKE